MSDVGTFGDWLRDRRKKRDLSQEELAERIEVSHETIRKIEAGTRRPSKQVAEFIAREFGVPEERREEFVYFARQGGQYHEGGNVSAYAPALVERTGPHPHPRSVLPSPPTTFIGREKEVAQVRELLLNNRVRLLTLTGPPGIGKTRLSLQASATLREDFEGAVFWVGLSPLKDPTMVVPAVCKILDVKEVSGQSILDTLTSYLRDKNMLLILDNFEQVVQAGKDIGDLLHTCAGLKVLVTSREALHVYGEHEFPVPAMALPEAEAIAGTALTALGQYEAVDLFTQRTKAVAPYFDLTEGNVLTVVQICRRLDALPLAIELAAARSKMLPPDALLARLDKSLPLLTAGMQNLPPRQRSLRAAIAWSYDLLNDEEKALYRRISVFVGTATLDAVEAVCNGYGGLELNVLEGVGSLLDKSLLRQDERVREPEFLMLWTIREYGQEQLEESGEAREVRRRHATYYLELAEEAEPHLTSGGRAPWLDQLESEYNNLRAALEWSLSEEANETDWETGLRLAGALLWFWFFRGHLTEGREWLNKALSTALGRTEARAKALRAAGRLAFYQYDYPGARVKLEESVEIWRGTGNKRGLAYALSDLGKALMDQLESRELGGLELIREGVQLFREIGDKWGVAFSKGILADEEIALYGFERGEPLYRESLALFQELGDRWGIGIVLRELGDWALRRGDYPSARSMLEKALVLGRESGDKLWIALLARTLGDAAYLQGDYSVAERLYNDARHLNYELGVTRRLAGSLRVYGHVMLHTDRYDQAERSYRDSLILFQRLDNKLGINVALAGLAGLLSARGKYDAAVCLFGALDNLGAPEELYHAVDIVEYKLNLAAVRGKVDQHAFETAWEHGKAMTQQQAVDYANEALDQN